MRIATIENETSEVESFLESQLRKARRISAAPVAERTFEHTPGYVITSRSGRIETLRSILDDIDPPSLTIVASTEGGEREASAALQSFGVTIDDTLVRVAREASASHVALVVLWDLPQSQESLDRILSSGPAQTIALLMPDEVPAFRRMTAGSAEPWVAPAKKAGVETRVRQLRTAINSTLTNSNGASASELALLAPLLDAHDPIEIAAAALRLYEGARKELQLARARALSAEVAGASSVSRSSQSKARQRIFLAVGKRDEVRVGDVVGAIANEAGISGDKIGQVELFESHTLVELSAEDAARAVEA
jgi:ATP-dependent RNA helicase DeaD